VALNTIKQTSMESYGQIILSGVFDLSSGEGTRYFIILAIEILHLLKLFEPSQCNTVLSTNNLFYYQFYMYINLWSAIFFFFVLLFIFDNLLFICYFCCLPIFV